MCLACHGRQAVGGVGALTEIDDRDFGGFRLRGEELALGEAKRSGDQHVGEDLQRVVELQHRGVVMLAGERDLVLGRSQLLLQGQDVLVGLEVMTNEGHRDFEALQKKFEPTQSTLNNLNQEIENLKKQLQTQGDKLNEQSRADMVKNIETKQKSLQRQAEDAQADFQGQQNEIANRIGGKLLEVLDKFAKQNSYSLILDVSGQQSPVLWAAQTSDVTQEIVNSYNAQSSVPAPVSAPGSTSKPAGSATRPPAPKPPAPKP